MTKFYRGARTNRGMGNAKGPAWYNSPFWNNVKKDKKNLDEKKDKKPS